MRDRAWPVQATFPSDRVRVSGTRLPDCVRVCGGGSASVARGLTEYCLPFSLGDSTSLQDRLHVMHAACRWAKLSHCCAVNAEEHKPRQPCLVSRQPPK